MDINEEANRIARSWELFVFKVKLLKDDRFRKIALGNYNKETAKTLKGTSLAGVS